MATNVGSNDWSLYDNPFRSAHVSASRIDMGYDIIGRGKIFALGPGIITEADHAWSGAIGAPVPGTYIVEHITAGPLKGRDIYTAEDVIPHVRVGQHVDMNTIIGEFTGSGSLETGFSHGTGGETLAAHLGQSAAGSAAGDPGKFSTAVGVIFGNILNKLGAPKDSINRPIQGSVPAGLPDPGPSSGGTGNVQTTSIFSSILGDLLGGSSITDMLSRLGLIVLGGLLILVGIWMLAGKQTLHVVEKGAKIAAVA
jgi:hypothetical protein